MRKFTHTVNEIIYHISQEANKLEIMAYDILFNFAVVHLVGDVSIIFSANIDPKSTASIFIIIDIKYFGKFVAKIELETQIITDCERYIMRLEKLKKDFSYAYENLSIKMEKIKFL